MILCPYCGNENREGMLFCENCGQGLTDATSGATLPTRQLEQMPGELSARATWGTASIGEKKSLIVHIRDVDDPVTVQLRDRTVIGRSDTTSPRKPDIDLSPYGALEKGVSRMHATIERNEDTLTLVDMGSSNGTHLNGQRLMPDQPRVLRDGDEIRFGKLITHIYFK